MTSPRRTAALVAVLAVCGCRDRDREAEIAPKPAVVADAAAVEPEAAVERTPEITLLDPGAEPTGRLRYDLEVGSTEKLTLTMSYSAENRLEGAAPQRLKFPGMKMVFSVEVVEAVDDGVRYKFELIETGLTDTSDADPTLVKMAGAGLKKSVGLRGSAVVDELGVIREGDLDIPAGLDPNMRVMMQSMKSSMEQLSSPLPAEPLGVGARWELEQNLAQAGVSLVQTTTYTLSESDKGERQLEGEIRQQAGRQEVTLPNVEKAELITLEAKGKSVLELDLGRLAPRSGTVAIESRSQFEITMKGQTRGLISNGSLQLEISGQ